MMPLTAPDSKATRVPAAIDSLNSAGLAGAYLGEALTGPGREPQALATPTEPDIKPDIEPRTSRPTLGIALIAAAGVLLAIGGVIVSQLDDDRPTYADVPALPVSAEIVDICEPDVTEVTSPSASAFVQPNDAGTDMNEAARQELENPSRKRVRRATKRSTAMIELVNDTPIRFDRPNRVPVTLTMTESLSAAASAAYQVRLVPGVAVETFSVNDLVITISTAGGVD